jgi:hypothetical protein
MTGRNRRCFRQMHLTEFTLFGDVLGSRIDWSAAKYVFTVWCGGQSIDVG